MGACITLTKCINFTVYFPATRYDYDENIVLVPGFFWRFGRPSIFGNMSNTLNIFMSKLLIETEWNYITYCISL